jgi:phospholipase/carboxylesterase
MLARASTLVLASLLLVDCGAADRPLPITMTETSRIHERTENGLVYYEVCPRGTAEHAELPMVVFFHGRGANVELAEMPYLAIETPFRFIAIEGPIPLEGGHAWVPMSAAGGESPALLSAVIARADELAILVDELVRRHPTRGKPIVVGFSQGGMMALAIALRHPDLARAAFAASSYLPPSIVPGTRRGPPLRLFHGEDDPVLLVGRTEEAVQLLIERGFDVEFQTYPGVAHEITPAIENDLRHAIESELERTLETSGSDFAS